MTKVVENIKNAEVGKAYEVWTPSARKLGAYLITEIIDTCFCCILLEFDDEDEEYYQTEFETSYDMSDGIILYPIPKLYVHKLFDEQ